MDKWFEPGPFAVRIFVSALGGSLTGWLYFSAPQLYSHGFQTSPASQIIAPTLFFVSAAFTMTLPLALIAFLLGLTVRKHIMKQPVAWTIAATFITWLTAISVLVLFSIKNQWWMTHSNAERLQHIITSGDSMLVLAGALGAGSTFYLLGLVRLNSERIA